MSEMNLQRSMFNDELFICVSIVFVFVLYSTEYGVQIQSVCNGVCTCTY